MLLFAFYALCHFGSLIIITEYICRRVPDANSHCRCTCWGFVSEVKLQKVYHSRFIIPVSLTCKYLEDGDLALSGPLSLSNSTSVFPFVRVLFSLSFQPHLSCLSSLSGCVSNIVQCSTWEYLINRRDSWVYKDLFISSPHTFLHRISRTHSIFLHFLCIHVQCFC